MTLSIFVHLRPLSEPSQPVDEPFVHFRLLMLRSHEDDLFSQDPLFPACRSSALPTEQHGFLILAELIVFEGFHEIPHFLILHHLI